MAKILRSLQFIFNYNRSTIAGMRRSFFLFLLLQVGLVFTSQGRSWYVRANSPAGLNGKSWVTAFRYFQVAIDSAVAGDSIRVSAGTYFGYEPSIPKYRFGIRSGAIILGGYPADGTPTDVQRNPSLNPVILSGEAGTAIIYDNVYHLVEGYNLSSLTVLDGFIIEKAANTNSVNTYNDFGAGMHLYNSSGTFRNLVFRNNYATNGGSAVCAYGAGNPKFINCIITDNLNSNGGTLHFSNGASLSMINCLIVRNRSGNYWPSANIYCNQAALQLTNVAVVNNSAEGDTINTPAPLLLENNSTLQVTNSIFYYNRVYEYNGYNGGQFYDSTEIRVKNSTAAVAYSLVENYNGGTQMMRGVLPRFTDTASVSGPDGKYFTADDGYHLRTPCSPALNAGNNLSVAAVSTDITGQPRIFNSGTVDLGPYESQEAPVAKPAVLYVNKTALGSNTGMTWQNAYTSLYDAINDCADTVKIASGTYYAAGGAFTLQKKMVWLGGYPASGNQAESQRNPTLYPVILDGTLPSTEQVAVVVSSKYTDSTAVMDGLQINRGGIGLKLYYQSSPLLSQVIFSGNNISLTAAQTNGALLKDCGFNGSTQSAIWLKYMAGLRLLRTTVTGAGARAIIAYNGSSLTADSCIFKKNIADGAALFLNNSLGDFNNCSFLGNYGTDGKDVFLEHTAGSFTNCVFSDSATGYNRYGGSIYLKNATPVFTGCSFNAHYGNNGGAVYGDSASPVFRRCIFDGNVSAQGGALLLEHQGQAELYSCIAVNNQSNEGSFIRNNASKVRLLNCTVVRQRSVNLPYAAANVLYNSDGATAEIRNSIFWANNTSYNSSFTEVINLSGALTNASNSFFQQFGTDGTNGNRVAINPRLLSFTLPAGRDGKFFTTDDGLQPNPCSPAANMGDNQYVPAASYDLAGLPRIYDNNVDIGAYELQQTANAAVSRTVFVRANAAGNNDGSSWQHAYTSLQSAIANSCADTIKISAGTYYPASTNRDSCFILNNSITMLGGYPDTGNPGDLQMDIFANPTILDGNIGSISDSTDNSRHVLYVRYAAGPVRLRHLTITNGFANGVNMEATGSGLLSSGSLLYVDSCRFIKNIGAFRGGGLAASGGLVQLNRCWFDSNSASRDGGAINFTGMQAGSSIGQSVCWRNTAQMGGALSFNGGADVYNTLLLENRALIRGGAVYVDGQHVNIVNSTFYGNSSRDDYGAGYYCKQAALGLPSTNSLNNCIFYANSSLGGTYYGSDLYDINCGFDNYCNYGVNVLNCLTQAYPSAWTGNPIFLNPGNYRGTDNRWFTGDDGLQLTECSVCVNAGNANSFNRDSTDITGLPRSISGRADIGAYEYQQPITGKVSIRPIDPGTLFFVGDTIRLKASGAAFYYWEPGYWETQDSTARYILTDTGTRNFTVIGYNVANCPVKTDTTAWSIAVKEKPYCPGAAFTIDAGYFQPYYNFYWEADTGHGYHAISDNAVFAGTQTKSLQVLQPDSVPYGTSFRCLITQSPQPSFYGNVYTIRFANIFYGSADSDWNNIDNWGCGRIPGGECDVFVEAGPHPMVINGVVHCHSLNVRQGAQVNMINGGQVIIHH